VFTPNVDHVVVADRDHGFRAAYDRADLSVCDGAPLLWTSGLIGHRLPARVAGSDLFLPLMMLAARRGYRVYLLGGAPGVGQEAARRLAAEMGVTIAGVSSPMVGLTPRPDEDAVVAEVAAAHPDLLIVCLGGHKAELWIDRVRDRLRPAVALGIGASLDFYIGRVRRAPAWMQRSGLEWLYRLLQEPRRLARRYLVDDPRFLLILLRTLRMPRSDRVRPPHPGDADVAL
jgi:N-acetylglucosaminyldiphosphoundecaprenol N-acetyl-beta-D-mannosaminyltransferase